MSRVSAHFTCSSVVSDWLTFLEHDFLSKKSQKDHMKKKNPSKTNTDKTELQVKWAETRFRLKSHALSNSRYIVLKTKITYLPHWVKNTYTAEAHTQRTIPTMATSLGRTVTGGKPLGWKFKANLESRTRKKKMQIKIWSWSWALKLKYA